MLNKILQSQPYNYVHFIALMEAEGKFVRYIMNGDWVMRRPGTFAAGGTTFMYNNDKDAEVLIGAGPTTLDLHIMVRTCRCSYQ